jgi:GH15 family glucan-1,4-alpha-glucosidase
MREMVARVERELAGHRGVVRYSADTYNVCHEGPPEWTMGFGFLALAWYALGEPDHGRWYLRRLESAVNDQQELPESWCHEPACSMHFNSPLCWSHALHVVATLRLEEGSELRPRDDGTSVVDLARAG